MKDTLITGRRKKIELISLLICFLLANLVNLYAILAYRASTVELLTSMGYVAVLTLFFYVTWSVVRFVYYGVMYLLARKKK